MTEDLAECDVALCEEDVAGLGEHAKYGVIAQTTQPIEIFEPAVTDFLCDQFCQSGIGQRNKTAWGHAVGHIAKFFRPQLREILHHRLLEQFGMELRHTIHAMAANSGEMRHPH